MHANGFDYYRADTVEEAVALLGDHEGAQLVAGAHDLLPRMKTGETAPPALVDVSGLDELRGIDHDGERVSVGALTTHADVAASEVVREQAGALAEAAAAVGDTQVRNGGTVGGNLASGDPRIDPAAAVLALDGTVSAVGPDGERTIDATEFFLGPRETALGDQEVLTELRVAAHGTNSYRKRRNPLSGYATVGVAAWAAVEDGTVADARVAATAVGPAPVRLRAVEEALVGGPLADSEAAAARANETFEKSEVRTDPQTSAAYRLHALSAYTERAVGAL